MVHLSEDVYSTVATAGGVQTQPGYFRKERRLNEERHRVPETPDEADGYAIANSGITSPPPVRAHPQT